MKILLNRTVPNIGRFQLISAVLYWVLRYKMWYNAISQYWMPKLMTLILNNIAETKIDTEKTMLNTNIMLIPVTHGSPTGLIELSHWQSTCTLTRCTHVQLYLSTSTLSHTCTHVFCMQTCARLHTQRVKLSHTW